jgi:uncharacterized Zn-finger protein
LSSAGSLKNHKLIHAGIRNHVCDVCNKAFTEASDLKRHKLIHAGIRNHVCDVCSKAFTRADRLKQHKLIHSRKRRRKYVGKYDICIKAFDEEAKNQVCDESKRRLQQWLKTKKQYKNKKCALDIRYL